MVCGGVCVEVVCACMEVCVCVEVRGCVRVVCEGGGMWRCEGVWRCVWRRCRGYGGVSLHLLHSQPRSGSVNGSRGLPCT